jgi:hypothetical protein
VVKGETLGDINSPAHVSIQPPGTSAQGAAPSLRPIVSPRQRNPNVRVVEALDPEVRKAGGDLLADQP